MSWFILFVMMQNSADEYKEIYTITSQAFESEEQCRQFVGDPINNRVLRDHILTVYPVRPVDQVYCIRQDVLNEALEGFQKKEK